MNKRLVTTLALLSTVASWSLHAGSPIDDHLQWDRSYSLPKGYDSSTLYAVIQTQDGGFVTVGEASKQYSDTQRAFVMKIDAQGKKKWSKLLGKGASASGVAQGPDQSLLVAESICKDSSRSQCDAYVVGLSPQGKRVWSSKYPHHDARAILPANDGGGYILVGTATPKQGDTDLWIAKIDPRGKTLWQKRYGGSGSDYGTAVTSLSQGGYLVGGTRDDGGSTGKDMWMLHLNDSGEKVWEYTVKLEGRELGKAVCEYAPGVYAVAGFKDISTMGMGFFIFAGIRESNSSDIRAWGKLLRRGNMSLADSILPDKEGGILAGGALGIAGNLIDRKPTLYDYDGEGKKRWHTELSGKGEVKAMIRTRDGGVLLVLDYNSFMATNMHPRILKIGPFNAMTKK